MIDDNKISERQVSNEKSQKQVRCVNDDKKIVSSSGDKKILIRRSHVATVLLYIGLIFFLPKLILMYVEGVLKIWNNIILLQALAYFLIFLWIVVKYHKVFLKELSLLKWPRLLKKIIIYGCMTIFINYGVSLISLQLIGSSSNNQQAIVSMFINSLFVTTTMVVLLAPIVEEFIYRYILQNWAYRFGSIVGISIATIIFALVHVQGNMIAILPYLGLGVCLGYIYYRTKNLAIVTGVHIFNNLVSVALIFIVYKL